MAESRNRQFAKLAKDITSAGDIKESGISSDVNLGGATIYATRSSLPTSGNTAGDQAFVTANSRLYIWNGSGWYNVALLNLAPSITSVLDSDSGTTPFTLSTTGEVTRVTITATDSDGDPLTYESSADSDFSGLATLSQSSNVFTITPLSEDSATTTSGTITFTATDGVNTASSGVQTFTLNFISPLWKNVVNSIGHSDGQGGTTAAVADRSGNGRDPTVTSSGGYPAQGSFHPYLDNWSVEFDGTDDYLTFADNTDWDFVNSGDFTVDFWMNSRTTSNISTFGQSGGGGSRPDKWGLYINDATVGLTAGTIGWHLGSNGNIQGPSITINVGQWYHIQVSRSSDTWYFFQDGTLLGTASSTTRPSVVANTLRVGSDGESYRDFSGHLSNFRIVKGTNLNTSSFTSPTGNLTAITNTVLLTCQDNRFKDNSSNAYTPTIVGTPKVSAFNPFGQGSEYLRANNKGSILFDDAFSKLDVPSSTDIGTGDFTFQAWVYPFNLSGTKQIISNRADGGSLFIGTNGTEFYPYIGGSYQTSGAALQVNAWSHLALTRTSGTLETYVNGVRFRSDTQAGDIFGTTGWTIGRGDVGEWDGYMADLQIATEAKYSGTTYTIPTSPVGSTNADLYLPMDNAYIFDKTGAGGNILNNTSTVDNTYSKFGSFAYKGARFNLPVGIEADKWTLEFWWRGTGGGDYFNLYNSSGTLKMRLLMQVDYGTNYTYRLGFTGGVSNKGGGQFADGWNHVALVKNGGTTVYLYENGAYVGLSSYGSEDITSSGGYIVFGNAHWYENIQFLTGVAKYTGTGSGTFTVPTVEQGFGTQTTGTAS